MSPSKVRLKTVAARAELIRERLAAIETLPLGSEAELLADPRMVAAGESFLWRSLEGLFDLGRHVLSKGFGKGGVFRIPGAGSARRGGLRPVRE